MFTPEYQSWLVSTGPKAGDKPAGYAPAVRNWAAEKTATAQAAAQESADKIGGTLTPTGGTPG
ncbi:hypothetical protein AB0F91_21540 [Amycolatopsis sp. NPDC023774]|uniref:hypothetical protein n=1 Tax=Amycolatopsis sp. NPDC023774 TaxID=3155015 RepID=UPI0033CF632D